MSQEELIEEIVGKVSERVLANFGKAHDEQPKQLQIMTPPVVYGIKIKGRFLSTRFKVIGHEEERFTMLGEQVFPVSPPRLILSLPNRTRIAIPNLDSLTYSVYPID
jgi:hypothetical protein